MSCEGPFTIDSVGKADFSSHLWPQFFGLSSQYQMWCHSEKLSDEKHRVKGLASHDVAFLPLIFAGCFGNWWCSVCPSQNIRSSWWMVTPLLFYFFLLGTLGAYSGILSTENTWFLFPWERFLFPVTFFFFFYPQLDQRKDWRKEVPPAHAVSSVCWLPTYFISRQHPLVPGCFWMSAFCGHTGFLSLQLSILPFPVWR